MKRTGDYYVIVVEDTNLGQIVATAMLIIEQKFIHSCAKVLDFSMEQIDNMYNFKRIYDGVQDTVLKFDSDIGVDLKY